MKARSLRELQVFLFLLLFSTPWAAASESGVTKAQIASLLIVGMQGLSLEEDPMLKEALGRYPPGGVILFGKNLHDVRQVRALTDVLQRQNPQTLLIALDQEGGAVDRLRKIEGDPKTPSATQMAHYPRKQAAKRYREMARRMHTLGFNLNFAPVVDLCANPKNRVIVKNHRCFAKDPAKVAEMARLFIDAHHAQGVLCTLKHFPGHGSSLGDSHKGFTDVYDTWQPEELTPYMVLIDAGKADLIMSAHIFNRRLDPRYPATLSYATLTKLLRQKLGFGGVIVSDDMQMGAIRKNYTLEEAVTRALNAGCDMLLFGNQLEHPISVQKLIDTILRLIHAGKISETRIEEAAAHVESLKAKINSISKKSP